jgi:hypothetical protein
MRAAQRARIYRKAAASSDLRDNLGVVCSAQARNAAAIGFDSRRRSRRRSWGGSADDCLFDPVQLPDPIERLLGDRRPGRGMYIKELASLPRRAHPAGGRYHHCKRSAAFTGRSRSHTRKEVPVWVPGRAGARSPWHSSSQLPATLTSFPKYRSSRLLRTQPRPFA